MFRQGEYMLQSSYNYDGSIRAAQIAQRDVEQSLSERKRNTNSYRQRVDKYIKLLEKLDRTDSNPGNGRVDISVFNKNLGNGIKNGYEACFGDYDPHNMATRSSVNIELQARTMADRDFGL